ncbi:hypothetical protein PR202_ga10335 [Eleusine coracana subsp. coracana]|uniref:Uncharacterized protein n=1 Tax=Eleusine coracana subsp. coracana TaxID=191504 RepID=A0AAV5C6G9_ELECO|nr:hypothetical protein PR202_ga10335 [Eleusine coracana subsp. coracana]
MGRFQGRILGAAVPQLPVRVPCDFAVCKLSSDLFPARELFPRGIHQRGLNEFVGCWFGAPMCHGAAGGRAWFGGAARSVWLAGAALGLVFASFVRILAVPHGIGSNCSLWVELAMASRDMGTRRSPPSCFIWRWVSSQRDRAFAFGFICFLFCCGSGCELRGSSGRWTWPTKTRKQSWR